MRPKRSEPSDLEVPMTTPTDDRRDLVTVFATMRAAPGKEDELRRWLESVVEPRRRSTWTPIGRRRT
jgi:hypothetical protein